MTDLHLHLAPNAPRLLLVAATLALAALGAWAYRFALPPLAAGARRLLAGLRIAAFAALLWLLAQPVLERALPSAGARVVVLVDHSASMALPAVAGGPSRREAAERAARAVREGLRGRAAVEERGFAATLEGDSTASGAGPGATALGDALLALGRLPVERRPDGVVVVSDGAVNAGADPVAAARALGVPVNAVLVGTPGGRDRAVAEVEAPAEARVGEAATVRVRVTSDEERGTPIGVRLLEDGRELARGIALAPGSGAEATVELHVTPARPGLAVWTARVDSLAGDASPGDDARGAAVQVAPGRLGVLVLTSGLNWDLAFLRRAWLGDSTLRLDTRVHAAGGAWRALERGRDAAPAPADLRGAAVVVLDALAPADAGGGFDAALAAFVRDGGGLLLLAGPPPGAARFARGVLGRELAFAVAPGGPRVLAPQPAPEASELLAWDEDPARGARAWRDAAPLADVLPLAPGGGDRVLAGAQGGGPPLLIARHVGRGQALLVNGTGFWRWSLSGSDPAAADRGRELWRHVVRWLAEPVQGEPLRVRPERWLAAFRPVAGATVEGEIRDGRGRTRPLAFAPRGTGSYVATLASPGPGRWQVSVRASRRGQELGRARSEFAVDRWSLEAARSQPDSATLAAVAAAAGGRLASAADAGRWAHGLGARALVRARTASARLWESPWLFGAVVAMLGAEWATRRRRGLP